MPALPLLILTAMSLAFAVKVAASVCNLRALTPAVPPEVPEIDPAAYAKTVAYLGQSVRLELLETAWSFVLAAAFLLCGGFGALDAAVAGLGLSPSLSGLVYLGVLGLAADLAGRPADCYRTFVLDARFDLNRTTAGIYLADMLKTYALTALVAGPLVYAALAFFARFGPSAWGLVLAVILVAAIVLQYVAPAVILPLFFKFTPLPEGTLRTAVLAYVEGQGFTSSGVFVLDGSRRSTRANAFFAGLGNKKRIGLYDTLIERLSVTETVAVLAHEVGHNKLGHVVGMLVAAMTQLGIMLFLLSLFLASPAVPESVGAAPSSLHVAMALFVLLYEPLSLTLGVAVNAYLRRNESAADAFAARTTGAPWALASALRKLAAANLSNLTPHRLSVLLYGTHPPLLARLRALSGGE